MAQGKSPIVFLSSIDWGSSWQRHQIFADQFAREGYPVVFVENTGFRNPRLTELSRIWKKLRGIFQRQEALPAPEGIALVRSKVLPPTNPLFRSMNSAWFIPRMINEMKRLGAGEHSVVVAYLPTVTTLEIIRRLCPAAVVYDCASNFRAHQQAPRNLAEIEGRLLKLAGLVVCDSDFLFAQKKAEHSNVVQIHQGVSESFFKTVPPSGKWKSFCYYGTWTPDTEPEFLNALAEAGFEVTVSGFRRGPAPRFHPSIRLLDPIDPEELPRRLESFDAFLFPYKITPFHLGVVPAKLYECMAMGRPVLASPLPSLDAYKDLLYIAQTPQEWVRIAHDLLKTETTAKREARIKLAEQHTHRREFSRFLQAVENLQESS